MNRNSVKRTGRSAKAIAPRAAKKSVKRVAGILKKAGKSSRTQNVAKARRARTAAARSPSVVPKVATEMVPRIVHTLSPPVQPMAISEIQLRAHKYQVGETVYYTSPTFGRAAAAGSYKVVKLLPSEGDDYQYRIKSSGEAFERVAKESQLDRA